MNFFKRHQRDGATTTTIDPQANTRNRLHGEKRTPKPIDMSRTPSLGQWLKVTWADILTMAIMGMIGLGVYFAPPAPSRSFPIAFTNGEIVYPQFAYPLRHEIVPIWLAALLASLIPIFIILMMQIRIRSFWDANNGILGLFYSLITAAVFQVFLKCLVGGLRPHFLAVCMPDTSKLQGYGQGNLNGDGYGSLMYDRKICTGDKKAINDALESFPSGHSTAAFAGFIYLSLYLNAKLKIFSNYHASMWKLIAFYTPILGAVLIAGSLTIDEFHNWYDCLAGAIIGTCMAVSAFRMVYRGVWDWRFNHLPLDRSASFVENGNGAVSEGGVFTRKAGWGVATGHAGSGNGVKGFSYPHGNNYINDNGNINGNNNNYEMRTSTHTTRKPVAASPRHGNYHHGTGAGGEDNV